MKADSKELFREATENADQALGDPFAVDVFATGSASFAAPIFPEPLGVELETIPLNQSWNSRLPRVKPDQVNASAAIAGLPLETYSQIQNSIVSVLARYSMTPPDQISISLVDLHETDFSSEVTDSNSPGVFATFTTALNSTPISFELGARFAARLVDKVLGGDGTPPDNLRSLTRTERAVVEFLCLSSASELNEQTGEPLLLVQSVSDQAPWWTSRIHNSATTSSLPGGVWKRGLVASLRVEVGEITGIARAYLKSDTISALDQARRQLRSAGQTANDVPFTVEELARFARVAPDLGLAVLVGRTEITLQELLDLESGDVMVVELPSLRWAEQSVRGPLILRVGDADETLINGEVSGNGDEEPIDEPGVAAEQTEAPQVHSIKMRVGALSITPPPRFAERLKMEEEAENTEALAEGAAVIDAVMLTVRVELAARRLRLDELSRLRVNQILDLGCKATDPVDLIVDGRRIARGDLVDIDGRLGVRITQVLV